ncbi:hypothetical protein SASPL_152512 [Salvia splendens]|uniref:RING-type E3 ubiquitin transferase n=1 Tax=Salvia splendens TaxID=180675 RepID=A0A8X8W3G2_SALSN|nr:hypothetical protein SASPL_152512 [Salvia splendens]
MEEGARTTWRMDLETAMVLVSNTLICIFVALQINHVKRYPKVASSISLLMLVILSVGQGLRLILSMEDQAVVRLSSLLVQLRLVQLVWERKPGCALLSLYVIGGLLAFVMNGGAQCMEGWCRQDTDLAILCGDECRFYSTAWDIVFSFAIVALLLLLFLQQRRRSTIAFSTHVLVD